VPCTLRNIKEDLEDIGFRFDGAPDLEFRAATAALELEESGLSYQRVPAGYRFPYGHTRKKRELEPAPVAEVGSVSLEVNGDGVHRVQLRAHGRRSRSSP